MSELIIIKMVDTCVQSNPTVFALVWGGLKFLMQVITYYVAGEGV